MLDTFRSMDYSLVKMICFQLIIFLFKNIKHFCSFAYKSKMKLYCEFEILYLILGEIHQQKHNILKPK